MQRLCHPVRDKSLTCRLAHPVSEVSDLGKTVIDRQSMGQLWQVRDLPRTGTAGSRGQTRFNPDIAVIAAVCISPTQFKTATGSYIPGNLSVRLQMLV